MAISTGQQAAVIAAGKGAFSVRPMDLDPFRSGSPYGKHAILEIKELNAFASIEVVTDLPIERLGRVSLERNNKEIIGVDADFFHKRDTKKGLPVEAKGVKGATKTRLIIPFADETLRTLAGIRRGELVHQAGEHLMLKVGVNAKEAGDPDIPEFSGKARVVDYQNERYFQQRYTQTSINHTQTGEQRHEFPLVGANVRLRSMLLECENDDITRVSIRRDKELIWEQDVEDIKFALGRYGEMNAPAKGVWIDFVSCGFANEQSFIPVAKESLKLVIDKRTTGTIDVFNDFIEVERLPE
ncbi:major capsid protein P2 [Vibrio sonorensis]|uniref:major capsid protein P2 n=1 Tax=Vibrio sonorensis TaxID=1004316 RepID=UPI0008DAEDA2|nr:major capsid protein P2 [Vibrio sonorensis]